MPETYSAQKLVVDSIETVRLTDSAHGIEVSICQSIGNIAYDMRVKDQPILLGPPQSLGEWKQKPSQAGIPFLGPWANGLPIHGLLLYASAWKVAQLQGDQQGAQVTSRLEFWKHPEWMAQFPFAHTITMTHRLYGGILEVRTSIENHSTDPMPLVIGFHPWYQMPGAPRSVAAASASPRTLSAFGQIDSHGQNRAG